MCQPQTGNGLLHRGNQPRLPASHCREGPSQLSCHNVKSSRFCRQDSEIKPCGTQREIPMVCRLPWCPPLPELCQDGGTQVVPHHSRQQHPTGGRYWRSAAPEPIPADLLHAPSSLGPAPDNNHWDQPHVHPQQQPQLRRSSLPWASSGSDQEGKAGEFLRALASSSVDGLCLSSMLGSLRVLLGSTSPPHSHKAELGQLLPLPWADPASEAHLHHPLKTSSPCFCCWQQL